MKNSKKVIIISIYEGVEAKNLLRTGVVRKILESGDIKVLLLTKNEEKAEYYRKEFPDPRIEFEIVNFRPLGGIDSLLEKFRFVFLRTITTDLKRKMAYELSKNPFSYYGGLIASNILARPFFRKLARKLDSVFIKDSEAAALFEKYYPSAVFLAHLFDGPEVRILRGAKRRGILSFGFINSWDKLTSRSMIRVLPDHLIVFNEIVKKETILHTEISSEKVYVSGIPQYDMYFEKGGKTRELFLKEKGWDLNTRVILYAPMGRAFSDSDWQVIDLLSRLVNEKKFGDSVNLLVRFQPNDFFEKNELEKRPALSYDYPGIRFTAKRGIDWDMDNQDLAHLKATLNYVDVVISYASSICVDAAIFDKPLININFEVAKSLMMHNPIQYYKTDHYGNVLKTGAVKLVNSVPELIETVNLFLENPKIDTEKRKKLVEEQCFFTDGKSAERITQYVLKNIKQTNT